MQFLFNDKTMSNFDISGADGGIAKFRECAVKPQDYHRIHKVSMLYYTEEGTYEDGLLEAIHIQDKQGTTLMKTALFDY